MRLTDLKPEWVNEPKYNYTAVSFDCPKCGEHRISVPIPPSLKAWEMSGSTFEDLTLSPSIAHTDHDSKKNIEGVKCYSHFFVKNGNIEMCE